jgi:hypothetical protein
MNTHPHDAGAHPGDFIPPQTPGLGNVSVAVEPIDKPLLETRNVALSAALATLGVPMQTVGSNIYRITGDGLAGPGQLLCAFAPRNEDGSVETAKVSALWEDLEWCRANDDSPLAWMRCFFFNLISIGKMLKDGTPMVRIQMGKYVAHIPGDLPQAEIDKYLQRMGM